MTLPAATACAPCTQEATEEVLRVIAARAGDADATFWLLARYRPPLVRLLTGMTADAAAAEDLAQEVFLHAFPRLEQLRQPEHFYAWIRKIAVREALRWLRGRRELLPGVLPDSPGGADPAHRAQTRVAVHAVLAALPPELRLTLLLREMEQLDYGEIAGLLRIPVGTVRSRLFAARARFRALWEAMEGEG